MVWATVYMTLVLYMTGGESWRGMGLDHWTSDWGRIITMATMWCYACMLVLRVIGGRRHSVAVGAGNADRENTVRRANISCRFSCNCRGLGAELQTEGGSNAKQIRPFFILGSVPESEVHMAKIHRGMTDKMGHLAIPSLVIEVRFQGHGVNRRKIILAAWVAAWIVSDRARRRLGC